MRRTSLSSRRICTVVFAVLLAVGLSACGQAQSNASGSGDSSASSSVAQEEQSSAQQSSSVQQAAEPYGDPWVSSIFVGNLPARIPEATDDLYTHYAYDYIADHQDGGYSSVRGDSQGELRAAVTAVIEDGSQTSPEMEQLRIFYDQAADMQTLEATGADELKPYLKAVKDTQSLDELEAVLLSDDFPFSPWIKTTVSAPDMMSNMCVVACK